ncbi:MAG: universal stress protein [Bacteroidetes bacterium]|nr:universal stress protein [Bacteroidota bacterium]
MDYTKLKRRSSYPFETIGVAVAFSPRLEALLAEAKIISDAFGGQLLLMHIGERTRTKEARLDETIRKLHIDENKTRVIWHEGNAVDTLLELCKLNIVDLLIVGAMQKENMLRYYLGSVARKISRKAKCSVLLLSQPNKDGTRFRKIIVNGVENAKTVHTINTAVYFGKHLKAKDITVATEVQQDGLAMAMVRESTAGEAQKMKKELTEEELNKVQAIVTNVSEREGIEIFQKQIKGKPGFAIRQFAENRKADLLVINSPDLKYGIMDRIFTHDMEYILENLPTNVLIVHSRVSE